MCKTVLVVAPHADDESLGCGGTLLRLISEGAEVHWLIFSNPHEGVGFDEDKLARRQEEVSRVAAAYGFTSHKWLRFLASQLDMVGLDRLVSAAGDMMMQTKPDIVLLPYPGDIHSDHERVFQAVMACTKWFRFSSVKKVLCYETLSETDLAPALAGKGFVPQVFYDISSFIDRKIEILNMFSGELACFPFPRSEKALRALASVRGAASGCVAAEAFMLVKEIN